MGKGEARDGVSHPEKPPSFSFLLLPSLPAPALPAYPASLSAHGPGWKCPQTSLQLPAVLPGHCSGNYQRTSLTTAWGIRLNPVNVFILKKRCTFNRKPWVFFFSFACIFFAKRKKKDLKKKSILENGKRCSRVCVRSCACVRCQPTVDSLLIRNRRSPLTLWPVAGQFPAQGGPGVVPTAPGSGR